ncbi:MAG: methyl-accepting chemotaxis protein, partial [Colwellia sp.]
MFKSLRVQIYALAFIPFLIIAFLGVFLQFNSLNSFGGDVTKLTEDTILDIEKERLKSIMDSVESLIQPLANKPGTEGYDEALQLLKGLTFDQGSGYIFGYKGDGERVLMGSKTTDIGKNYWDLQDKKNQYIIRDLINKGKSGDGFYTYWFPKPNESEASPKYGYAIYISQWDLMLGTGFYIDSMEQVISTIETTISNSQTSNITNSAITTLIVAGIVGFIVSFAIKLIYSDLKNLSASVKALANGEGDLTQTIVSSPIDILNDIANYFNHFIKTLGADVRNIKKTSLDLSEIAVKSTDRQRNLEHSSDRQKLETIQVSTAVEEMASTSAEIA